MQILCCHIAALGVASIFYTWRSYCGEMLGRHRLLRDRVAYMLWVTADLGEELCAASGQEKATAGV